MFKVPAFTCCCKRKVPDPRQLQQRHHQVRRGELQAAISDKQHCINPSTFSNSHLFSSAHFHYLDPRSFTSSVRSEIKMDTLVAQYSRPAYQEEGYSQEEQLELVDVAPPMDLKFALPPTAQVSISIATFQDSHPSDTSTGIIMAPRNDRRPQQPQLPHQDCSRNHHSCFPLPRRYHCRHRFACHSRKLDCFADGQEGH